MAVSKNFRTALGGFNRQDVVRYIQYMNNQHSAELEQLNSQLQLAQEKQNDSSELLAQLEAAQARCTELEAQLEGAGQGVPVTGDELEAYRRAERAERLAKERAEKVYHRVNGVLADATVKVDQAAATIGGLSDQVMAQLAQLHGAVSGSKQALQDAVDTMYALRPTEE